MVPIVDKVRNLLARYGSNTTSFQVLEPGLDYWFSSDGQACVAYAKVNGAWVAAGAPIAPPAATLSTMHAFADAARSTGQRARFFAVESQVNSAQLDSLCIGAQPVWDPTLWDQAVQSKRSLREQFRRARAKGVITSSVASRDVEDSKSPIRLELDNLIAAWKSTRAMAPMGFVVQIHPFSHSEERRYLIARYRGDVVGLIVAVPIYAREGWFLEDVLRCPTAPNGTIELLFDHAIRMLGAEGSRHVTFGLAPLAEVDNRLLQRIRDHSRWLYDFGGLYAFKKKLMPSHWQKVYLTYPSHERGISAVTDVLRAFADGSLVRFGARTLRHRASLVVGLLAVALLPWTLALIVSPAWFPSPGVHLAWVSLDVTLMLGLWRLAAQWQRGLAMALAILALVDGVLGSLQAVFFNFEQIRDSGDTLLIAIAIITPFVASCFLWTARDHRVLVTESPSPLPG